MSPPTETRSPTSADEDGRIVAIRELVELLDVSGSTSAPPEPLFDAVSTTLTDALIGHDQGTLSAAGDVMRPLQSSWIDRAEQDTAWARALGRLQAILAFAVAGAERLVAPATQKVAASSRERRVLAALGDGRTAPTEALRERTGLSSSAISHSTRRLVEHGLLMREQVGKGAYWTITPQGQAALDAAGDTRERRGRSVRRRRSPAPEVVTTTTWAPLEFDGEELRRVMDNSQDAVLRSRLLCMELIRRRQAELTTRLLSWDSLGRFAADDRVQFAVAPLDMGKRAWGSALESVVRHACGPTFALDLQSFWPATLPGFDSFAVVRGKDGRNGVVLMEAKTETREFRLGKARVTRDDSRRQIERAFEHTARCLGATREWHQTSAYPDAMSRLVMLAFLRERGIPAWLLNLYFVPTVEAEYALPGPTDWWNTIEQVRDELAISEGHRMSDFVKHEFVEIPESPLLAMT